MNSRFPLCVFTLVLLLPLFSAAQESSGYEYSREFVWGINKNTNSGLIGGFILKFSREIKDGVFETFGGEIINVKHPQEFKYFAPASGRSYIWGKQNYLYALRGQYGREMILYKKAAQQGVQINGQIAGGPTLGILAPYIVELSGGSEQYDPSNSGHSQSNILGTGRLLEGIDQSQIIPGLNAKVSLSFEFGTFKSNVTGFELGFMGEVYSKEVVLVPVANNRSFFTSAFITLFYGNRQ